MLSLVLPSVLLAFNLGCGKDTGVTDTHDELIDADQDGYDEVDDCDDQDAAVNPGATEVCNGIDDNCDGVIDEGLTQEWYTDADADGFGDVNAPVDACEAPDGTVGDSTDCDDADDAVNPDATEICNEVDDDCNGTVDDDLGETWYADADSDGYGDAESELTACTQPSDYVSDATDCDDSDTDSYPTAPETCGDGIDQDCNGADLGCRITGTASASTAAATLLGQDGEYAGARITGAGDINADGYDDMWVGMYAYGPTTPDHHGAVALVLGPVSGTQDIADAASAILSGEEASDYAGWDFQGGDDLDGDGVPDIAIGAYGAGSNGSGYVVSGASITGDLSLADAAGEIVSGSTTSLLGYDLDTSADLTGDGVGDVILGSYGSGSDTYRGHAWIVAGPVTGQLTLSDAYAVIDGDDDYDLAGNGVGGVGDTNGDGTADLLVGAHGDDGAGDAAGAAGLYYGPLSGNIAFSAADRTVEGENPGDELSRNSVGGRGDIDGDGLDDVGVGTQFNSNYGGYAGALYIVLGSSTDTGTMNAANAEAQIYGTSASDYLGRGFDFGDLDGDGFADVAVGAFGMDTAGTDAGATYVFYGPVSGALLNTDADATYLGVDAGDNFGLELSVVGDTNGDGQLELMSGAWRSSEGGTSAGAAYLFQ